MRDELPPVGRYETQGRIAAGDTCRWCPGTMTQLGSRLFCRNCDTRKCVRCLVNIVDPHASVCPAGHAL